MCRPQCYRVERLNECNKRTRAEELFRSPILAPFCFGASSVFQRLSKIASNGLECFSELTRGHKRNFRFAVCSQVCRYRQWTVSSSFIMRLNYLGVRIKGSCLRIYEELVSREFSFQFSSKCLTPSKRDRVFSVAAHLCLLAIAKSLVLLAANGPRIGGFGLKKLTDSGFRR